MALTKEQAYAIAALMHELRPAWDIAGCVAALRAVARRDPLDVSMAAIRLCATPEIRTPGALSVLDGTHWQERISTPTPMQPPKRDEECRIHAGQWANSCNGCASDKAAGTVTELADYRRPDASAKVLELRRLVTEATAACCSHGVRREHCKDNHEEEA